MPQQKLKKHSLSSRVVLSQKTGGNFERNLCHLEVGLPSGDFVSDEFVRTKAAGLAVAAFLMLCFLAMVCYLLFRLS